jgi:hypothetical protein
VLLELARYLPAQIRYLVEREEIAPLLTLNLISLTRSLQRAKDILEDRVEILKWQLDLRCQQPKLLTKEEMTDNILSDYLRWNSRPHFIR